uniref:Molybdate-anion transporter n=1 Tax=Chromera velia CCMP2878 TaxID=1169474 RepID=A0A0G4I4A9_9ALVE|mmetsp:Transcript_34334/g.67854  ORF Transcript_34334/g.67854 Transcript_34334/m.67854 type:complete len:460 (-) Transcript_34334:71-1450(-)|eukprot:Cvel_10835.t1-p1 / transcript=Cvel_10835.t1 / gene=Cvel_10835 / organism=Chromera_velia_CCMP2878 / gene_product=Major facilitator superfamily domain-containing, putative / transcript_product=Major facilitator superfamily domain-containing, putative / location=Cvel_scaffold663:6626-8881(+) / protein_length=459 / sequence_SO=supercontig / SO=protein_coding / is_pseudo=false
MPNLEHLPVFIILAVVAVGLQVRSFLSNDKGANGYTEAFRGFQTTYLLIYGLVVLSDWLQGPYVYQLYREYGFTTGEIGQLFIAGFGASAVCGVFIGSVADAFGRKKSALGFCVAYIISCLTKHVNQYSVLMVGRLTGGIATSLLFSVFDAWMVHEHHHRNFPEKDLGDTFAKGNTINGAMAIIAGLIASFVVAKFGTVAPFDLSIVVLVLAGVAITIKWTENYGKATASSSGNSGDSMLKELTESFSLMLERPEIPLVGLMQSFFEGSMYTFVFLWTPALPENVNHGLVFSCFMVAVMLGSSVFSELSKRGVQPIEILIWVYIVGGTSLMVPALSENPDFRLAAFLLFELVCGMYFCSFYTCRGMIVPDKGRATILNIYRVPLNLIVMTVCLLSDKLSQQVIFAACVVMLVLGGLCTLQVASALAEKEKQKVGGTPTSADRQGSGSEEVQLTGTTADS